MFVAKRDETPTFSNEVSTMVVRCCSFTIATRKILAYFAHLFII
jgi:hypothetical protein